MTLERKRKIIKTDFLTYQAQTTTHPLAMEISHANGSYIYDKNNIIEYCNNQDL